MRPNTWEKSDQNQSKYKYKELEFHGLLGYHEAFMFTLVEIYVHKIERETKAMLSSTFRKNKVGHKIDTQQIMV